MTTTVANTKIGEIENKIADTNGLVSTTVLNTKIGEVESKIPDVSGLVKKMDYKAKISDIDTKYFTTSDYKTFRSGILETKVNEKGLVDKSNFSNLVKKFDLNIKLATLTTKAELKEKYDKIMKFQAFNSNNFRGKSHFEDDDRQN